MGIPLKELKKTWEVHRGRVAQQISRDAMSMLSRRHCSICSKHIQRHAKTLGRGTKVKSPVPAGRQVGTKSACNEGKLRDEEKRNVQNG